MSAGTRKDPWLSLRSSVVDNGYFVHTDSRGLSVPNCNSGFVRQQYRCLPNRPTANGNARPGYHSRCDGKRNGRREVAPPPPQRPRASITSGAYFNLPKEYGITPSTSRRGNPYDNALAENFFSMLKAECISREKIQSFEQAQRMIDDYIFFQFERFQLKYRLTPFDKRSQTA